MRAHVCVSQCASNRIKPSWWIDRYLLALSITPTVYAGDLECVNIDRDRTLVCTVYTQTTRSRFETCVLEMHTESWIPGQVTARSQVRS